MSSMSMKLRVAVIGAGPAGVYASDILVKADRDFDVSVDLFERLPAPYGLVRYGVAPDHPRIKGIINALRDTLDSGSIRLFSNVAFGTDITLEELQDHYHVVIFATGALDDVSLNVPGSDLAGSFGAAHFVNWYDGHPDFPRTWPLDAEQVAVIGNGNVALDVARILAKPADDLLATDIPDNVYQGLKASKVKDVHVFGRRGPAFVKFSPLELRELGEVGDVDIVLDERDFAVDEASERQWTTSNQRKVLRRIFDSWRKRSSTGASRRIIFHFWEQPVAFEGTDRLEGMRVERTRLGDDGRVEGTGEQSVVAVGQAYRAVGYYGSALPGVPFDVDHGVLPNAQGRVLDDNGDAVVGEYVTGWIKRGPVGLIGSTKSDAAETVAHLIEDADAGRLWAPTQVDAESIPALLRSRGVRFEMLDGWHRLDARERALGAEQGRERIKLVSREEMLDAAEASAPEGK